ncbi:MAG: hypothetical protein V1934_02645 [Methanobacteriota archaeon]
MPEAQKPSGFEKASTVLAPTLNTLVFIIIARELGAESLGSVALYLSLAACITLSFDLGHAWGGAGGRSLRALVHLSFTMAGFVLAAVGWLVVGCDCIIALGLYAAYHGATSAAIAISQDGGTSAKAGLADGILRVAILAPLIYVFWEGGSGPLTIPIAFIFAVGGLAALAVATARYTPLSISAARSELGEASGGAFAFSILAGLMMWVDKPLLYLLDGEVSLGFYFAVQRTVVFIGAAGVVIAGMVSGRFSLIDREAGKRLATLMERYASLCVIPMGAFYIAFSRQIVATFFGMGYAAHHALMYPMAFAGVFTALASPSLSWLASDSKWRALAVAAGSALTVLVCLAVALLESEIIEDPSTAAAVGCAISSLALYVSVRAILLRDGVRMHGNMPKHVACAVGMAISLHWVSTSFAALGLAELVFLALAGVLVYGLLLYLFGEFMQGEYGEFKALRGV